jgi:hypothetical protein
VQVFAISFSYARTNIKVKYNSNSSTKRVHTQIYNNTVQHASNFNATLLHSYNVEIGSRALNSSGCQGVITAFHVTTTLTMVVLPAGNLFPHVSYTQIDRDLSSVMTNDTRVRGASQVGSKPFNLVLYI